RWAKGIPLHVYYALWRKQGAARKVAGEVLWAAGRSRATLTNGSAGRRESSEHLLHRIDEQRRVRRTLKLARPGGQPRPLADVLIDNRHEMRQTIDIVRLEYEAVDAGADEQVASAAIVGDQHRHAHRQRLVDDEAVL